MGKIKLTFSTVMYPNGLDFDFLFSVVNALPGLTHLHGIINNPSPGFAEIEMVNNNFLDGTYIIGKFRTCPITNLSVFDGIDIVPPTQSATSPTGVYQTQTNSSFGNGWHIFNPQPQPPVQPISVSTPTTGNKESYDTLNLSTGSNKPTCTCGASKVGGGHSSWCDIEDLSRFIST